jgi:hypothetical protein
VLDPATDEKLQRASDRMAEDWADALDRLLVEWDLVTVTWRDQLVEQVRQAVVDNDVERLAAMEVEQGNAVLILTDYLDRMFETGEDQIAHEAADQGVTLDVYNQVQNALTESILDILRAIASAVVALLGKGLADSVAREALRLWGTDPDADEIARRVGEHVDGLSDRALKDQLGGSLTNAMNRGRLNALLTAPTAVWYASERNDSNACKPCRDVDERRFSTLEEANAAYPAGGYIKCEGGVRCRGSVVPVWET